jgi:hypothetical protein
MILYLNHVRRDAAAATTNEVIATLLAMLEEGQLEPAQFARLRIHLDWIQYRQNFREAVMLTQTSSEREGQAPVIELRIDSRQVAAGTFREAVQLAFNATHPELQTAADARIYLEEFHPFRSSIAWDFNRLYWHRLKDWEQATGRGYDQALPGGKSEGNDPAAIADSVADFWTLLKDLDSQNKLPAELFVLEIGVGMGVRAGCWLDRFRALDNERGTNYYPRLRFLLGDYSLATLDRSRPAVRNHVDLCSFIVLDALDPMKTLSFLRHKVLHVHLTNVYDNLPDEELVRREGSLYWLDVRAYLTAEDAAAIAKSYEISTANLRKTVERLLEIGPECLPDRSRGVAFWQDVWKALRLEERLVDVNEVQHSAFPEVLGISQLTDILEDAPSDLRFHLSSGALESFRNTLPLLHPRGYLQVQDIFVTSLNDYRMGFHGPGKLDGSIVNWVNGVFLREVAERAGYDLHFAPFHYRPGSKASVLYTTQRE